MRFAHGRTVIRLRAREMPDPYSAKSARSDWDDPEKLEVAGAFVAQTSTSLLTTATREQAVESKSLFCDGEVDIAKGDRILDPATGAVYTVAGIPPVADANPFTGWTPPREIPLTRYVG